MNKSIDSFNIRVYALIIENDNILISKELIKGEIVLKFPGGGVEFGEGFRIATPFYCDVELPVANRGHNIFAYSQCPPLREARGIRNYSGLTRISTENNEDSPSLKSDAIF